MFKFKSEFSLKPDFMRNLILWSFLLCTANAFAQSSEDPIPAFGKVTRSEMEMKECAFDKNAEAEILLENKEVLCKLYAYSVDTEIKRHIRIKILNNKGLDHANIHIPFYDHNGEEKISDLQANTYNLSPSGEVIVSQVDKKSFYKKALNKRISEIVFTFPEVKPGSVIEYEYKVLSAGVDGVGIWYFQRSLPVKLSRYKLTLPEEIETINRPYGNMQVKETSAKEKYNNITVYTMNDVPALREEPYMTCADDYLWRISVRLTGIRTPQRYYPLGSSWGRIVAGLMQDYDFGDQLKKDIPRTDELEALVKKAHGDYEKMATIFYYVQKNMEWNGYDNIWALNGVKTAWKEKKGTTGEINLILVNLLKQAGLDAHPLLVSTRENGRINIDEPSYRQFNKVLGLVGIKNRLFILDATDKFSSPKLIPYDVMYSDGLLVEKFETFEWGWKSIWDQKQLLKEVTILMADVDSTGSISGEATINSYDYSRYKILKKINKNEKAKA